MDIEWSLKLYAETHRALREYGAKHDYPWLEDAIAIEASYLAWLIFLLRQEPDSEELFPHGKWATIQRLELLVEQAATREIAERNLAALLT